MSGSWQERAEAGQPLKPADLANALNDLAAGLHAVRLAIVELGARDAVLAKGLADNEATLAGALERLAKCEGPTPVAPKTQGGKAAGGSS